MVTDIYLALILRSQTELDSKDCCIRGKKCKFFCCTHTENITQHRTTTKQHDVKFEIT